MVVKGQVSCGVVILADEFPLTTEYVWILGSMTSPTISQSPIKASGLVLNPTYSWDEVIVNAQAAWLCDSRPSTVTAVIDIYICK